MSKEIIQTKQAPSAIGPYSQAVKYGQTIYISGQIPLNPNTGNIEVSDFKEQAIQVFKNIEAILNASGASLKNLVKINAYLTNLDNFTQFNEVMLNLFNEPYPARAALEVSKLPKNALIEVEGIAILDKQ